MRSMTRWLIGGFVLLVLTAISFPLVAAQEAVSFESGRWTVTAGKVQEFLGRKAFQGTAFLNDVQFMNGTIEVDVAVSSDRLRSYPGILFRIAPGENWERFYIRPHRHSLYADTLQYVPAFSGVDSWQLYSGDGCTAGAVIPVNEWFRVKIEVSGAQARVFIGASPQPALRIPDLRHGLGAGALGVMGPVDGSSYFSNFSYRQADLPAFTDMPPTESPPGALVDWQISKPFAALKIEMDKTPAEQGLGDLSWKSIKAGQNGLVDIGRLHPRSGEPDAVFAKTMLTSEKEETRKFDIGYSDIVSVFLNGRLLFEANSQYQSRDSSFLGVVGYFDSLMLPLKQGENELLLTVAEISGGWGFMVRDGQAEFALEGIKKAWETPRSFSVPESVAYDKARSCLYVSNYDGYKPSPAEGRQAISKVGLDGSVLALEWVKGLRNPTGLCVVGDRLWAVERGSLVEIDIPGERILNRIPLPEARMPNDVAAAADGTFYVTDSARSAIYKVSGGKAEVWLSGPEIGRPNGIAVDDDLLIVGTNLDGCLKSVDLAAKTVSIIARLGTGIIDGIQVLSGDSYLVSHNEGRLYLVRGFAPLEGTVHKVLDLTVRGRNTADFVYIRDKVGSFLVFPTFTDNRLTAYIAPPVLFMSYETASDLAMNERRRDAVRKIDLGLDTVGISPGMTVGEVGAGEGYLVLKLASRVGPAGRVLAEDIFPRPLETLRRRAEARDFKNIETILGKPEDPVFPRGILDMVFMHATMRFVKDPVALFRNIVPALKPGGRIIVIEMEKHNAADFRGRPLPEKEFPSREEYVKLFEAAGLKAERIDDATLPHMTLFVLSPEKE